MRIEFFHDVICSFCFPMSARMRKIAAKYPGIDIVHRSFALGWREEDFVRMFGSRKAVKREVLRHWEQANRNDDEHRFQIEGMAKTDFDFPLSKIPLIAAKSAGILGGENAYWNVFDALQRKFFVENKNIEEFSVVEEAVQEAGVALEVWRPVFRSEEAERQVVEDFELARRYGISGVPTLLIDGRHFVHGAVSTEELERIIERWYT